MMAATRREQKRQQTYADIKACARDLMREQGTAGISIRGITRSMGFSATALYRYYDSLDALITDLIVDAFHGLADAVESAQAAPEGAAPDVRFVAALIAYRQWAEANPVQFQLIYGNPIPHYVAPPEVTVPVSSRKLRALTLMLLAAMQAGQCQPPAHHAHIPSTIDAHLQGILLQSEGEGLADMPIDAIKQALYLVLHVWARVHGMVMLALFDHLPPTVGDMNSFFRQHLLHITHDIGMAMDADTIAALMATTSNKYQR